MEPPQLPVIAKKFWNIVRVAYFMLRKGISKSKLMIDLNMMIKRKKIAGKAMAVAQNLMFHHAHNWSTSAAANIFSSHRRSHHDKGKDQQQPFPFTIPADEYEFSCSNSPAFPSFHLPFNLSTNKRKNGRSSSSSSTAQQAGGDDVSNMAVMNAAVMKALEMIHSEAPSPALPGFGRSPMVRQLRVTDSPFPLKDVEEDNHIDEAAEEFITKFYNNLRLQSTPIAKPRTRSSR